MTELIDFSDGFTKEGLQKLSKGQTLGFKQEDGSINRYKIVRLNKSKGIVKVEPVTLYTQDEINDMPRKEAERIIKHGK